MALALAQARAAEIEAAESRTERFHAYRFRCDLYITDVLGGTLWRGIDGEPGPLDICEHVNDVVRQLEEKVRVERGDLAPSACLYYQPGTLIQNHIRIPGCHSSGKTWLVGGLTNWFFDAWGPCIIETFAPTQTAVNDLLWKEIRDGRERADLEPRAQEVPKLRAGPKWFARGRATSDAGGAGRERIQGQHADRMMFVFDEAEKIPTFVWSAAKTMMAGAFVLAFSMANPRTRTSTFHKMRAAPEARTFRLNGLYHPNVYHGRTLIAGGSITRDWVERMLREHCKVVPTHNTDTHTFETPWAPGTIYEPDSDFLYQVLALAPANMTEKSLITTGRLEAAIERGRLLQRGEWQPDPKEWDKTVATAGLDPARWGQDEATLYVCWNGMLWREAAWPQSDGFDFLDAVRDVGRQLAEAGVQVFHVRIDSGGGWGTTAVDLLSHDVELADLFEEFVVVEVNSEGRDLPGDLETKWLDWGTACYAVAAEVLKVVAVVDPPPYLEEDLTEREVVGCVVGNRFLKRLEPKDTFKKRKSGRSPNDGDGAALALPPISVLQPKEVVAAPVSF